jgi:hypothetical protein
MRLRHERQTTEAGVTIRRLRDNAADRVDLDQLAQRDSRPPVEGPALVAEVEGRILAAISLADGTVVADPFSRTSELRSLLELRAGQLRRRQRRERSVVHLRPARAALASSPPGAGGRLLELDSRPG